MTSNLLPPLSGADLTLYVEAMHRADTERAFRLAETAFDARKNRLPDFGTEDARVRQSALREAQERVFPAGCFLATRRFAANRRPWRATATAGCAPRGR